MSVRIRRLTCTRVVMPLEAPTRWALGVHADVPRLLVHLETDEGIAGVGETYHVPEAEALLELATTALAGLDPLEVGVVQARLAAFGGRYDTMMPLGLVAGIETACLDAAGRAHGVSVSTLLGGAHVDRVEVAAYLFFRERSADGRRGGEGTPEALVARAEELVARYGFRVLKLKGGVLGPGEELRTLRLLRERFGDVPLRWDPNGAWSLATALRCAERLRSEGLALEYLEDPVADLAGMAALRARVGIPLATNMSVVAPEHLAPAVHLGAVDVVLADPHYWGGFAANRRMMAVCRTFGLGVGMHSDNDLGISTAAKLHLAATSPEVVHAIDSHHPEHESSLLAEPIPFAAAHFAVPTGPGLGVELDPELVARYRVG